MQGVLTMRTLQITHRLLSLSASWVFLVAFAILALAILSQDLGPARGLSAEKWAIVLLAPALIPAASIVVLAFRWLIGKRSYPFMDGWCIHLLILTLYLILAPSTFIPLNWLYGAGSS